MKAIINATLMLEHETLNNGYICYDTHIRALGPMSAFSPVSVETIWDAKGAYVMPGFLDIHIHGFGGADTMDGTQEALETISKSVRRTGVTGFLPTTMTMPTEAILQALDAVKTFVRPDSGARVFGVHLEGPFIHEGKKGAQNAAFIQAPNMALIEAHLPVIKMITLAPDTKGAFAFIEQMKAYPHIKLSIGHTCSDYETALAAYEQGVNHITHCFNAMPPLHHREPGVLGAMLGEDFSAELIADNIHVHKGLYKGLVRCLGKDKLVLVTDSMCAGGLLDGAYELGGQAVTVEKGAARLKDGTLAGSVLSMNLAIKNVFESMHLPLHEVGNFASINPARVIGVDQEYGSIAVGKVADLAVVDLAFNVVNTIVSGEELEELF